MPLGLVAFVPTSCNSCHSRCWNDSSKGLHLAGVTQWMSPPNRSIALWRSALDQVVAACQAVFWRTWNHLSFVEETFSAPYTRASIVAQILWMFSSHNRWDSHANRSSTLAVTDFDIVCTRNIPFFCQSRLSALSGVLRDRFEWFCWLTSRENSPNARTAPIAISLEAVSTAVFPSSLAQTRIGAQFTASVLMIRQIFLTCGVPVFKESAGFGKCWRPGYRGTDVNWLSN